MSKISPCLWFDSDAEEAANFYVSLLPGSRAMQALLGMVKLDIEGLKRAYEGKSAA